MPWLLLASTPPPFDGDPDTITPGVWGFVVTFAVVIVVVLLILDMVRRTRRIRYRAEINERLDAEEAQRTEGDAAERPDA